MKIVKDKVFIRIINSQVESSRVVKTHNKFQRLMGWVFKLSLADKTQYQFRIQYSGNYRLRLNDVVTNRDSVLFAVMQERNRYALIVSAGGYTTKPFMRDKLYVLPKSKTKKII